MGEISLEGMKFYAYHGVYEEEQIIGTNYTVDVFIETDFNKAVTKDDILKTINYETVYLICQAEMRKKVKLIETLNENIITALKRQFSTIKNVRLHIKKANPIPGARLSHSAVETEENYESKCPRCKANFICYNDNTCWCHNLRIHPKTREAIKLEFKGCLCKNCLSFYAG
ncbi:MAG: dihydroneopterin aldolase [Saprospiraceae bacterium]|jgi:dihydroneopterin aldolase